MEKKLHLTTVARVYRICVNVLDQHQYILFHMVLFCFSGSCKSRDRFKLLIPSLKAPRENLPLYLNAFPANRRRIKAIQFREMIDTYQFANL